MSVIVSSLLLAIGLPFLAVGASSSSGVVAECPDWKITADDLDRSVEDALRRQPRPRAEMSSEERAKLRSEVLEGMISRELILAQATASAQDAAAKQAQTMIAQVRMRFPSQEAFEEELKSSELSVDELKARFRDRELITAVLDAQVPEGPTPGVEEMRRYYEAHPEAFRVPPKVRASRVLVLTDRQMSEETRAAKRKAIEQARERVLQGEDFAEVAREVSEDKFSASAGGDIGFFQQGANETPFDEMAFRLPVGEVSPVFETMVGYWFIKVTDTREATVAPFEEAEPQISEQLAQEQRQARIKAYVAGLEQAAHVVRHPSEDTAQSPTGGRR